MHDSLYPIIPMIGFLAIVAIIAVVSYLASEQRRKEWQSFAAAMGFRYAANDPFGTVARASYAALRKGHSRHVTNVAYGAHRGRQVRCFDFRYTVGHGKSSHTYHETMVLVESPIACPEILVRPEHLGDRIAAWVGADDIDLESAAFSERFFVSSPDKRFAYDLLHQRAMEYLLACSPQPAFEAAAGAFLFDYAGVGQLPLPTGVRALLDTACDFLDLIPAYLVQGGGAPVRA